MNDFRNEGQSPSTASAARTRPSPAEAPRQSLESFLGPLVTDLLSTGNRERPRDECALPLSARLFRAQDEERRRISRELHDTVGQSLTAVLINLERLSRTVTDKTLKETIDLVKNASREVRTVSYLMHPPILDFAGLKTAVKWYVEGFNKRSGIKTEVQTCQEVPRLPIEKETALFRIVQECLTNVHRHSGATKAWIRIVVNERQMRLEVEDNGRGFAEERWQSSSGAPVSLGVGIPGMCERMRELGGSLRVETGKNGTKVTAVLSSAGASQTGWRRLGNAYRLRPEIAQLMNDAANGCFFK
jgi:signal transduction histidine kinase